MKKISRTPFNKIFIFCVFTTVLFIFLVFVRGTEYLLLYGIVYLISITLIIISNIRDLNDIEFNHVKIIYTNVVTGRGKVVLLRDLKSIYKEAVSFAGILIVFHYEDDSKDKIGIIGCDTDEISEMLIFINKKIQENKEKK
ncbi:hypothetical protein C9994_07530 [Marivirga lumbricoides]|uniref:Uncharacterized protein n=1 Tax=Marivirga lumbricoides TaxID=1046115 RepID=A0A2T4DRF7_9BACT|nr:hypothetical protein C9994_07530 [Marivirga lumbricoides]